VLSDTSGDDYIEVSCGVLEGKLYFGMMKDCTGSQLSSMKCTVHNDSHMMPGEFEQKGGKLQQRTGSAQRKALLIVLPTFKIVKTRSQSLAMRSVPTPGTNSSSSLVKPILAFVKAYKTERLYLANLSSTLLCYV